MIKTVELSGNTTLKIDVIDEYDYAKRLTDEYWATVELIYRDRSFILAEDYINYLSSNLFYIISNTEQLCNSLGDGKLGLAFNYYSHSIGSDTVDYPLDLVKKEGGFWIGSKYSLYETNEIASWIYKEHDQCFLELTPLYPYRTIDKPIYKPPFFKSEERAFRQFVKNYKSILKITLSESNVQAVKSLAQSYM
ncbi:MAG: hypothetical protein LBR68_03915 [Lachnoclostridium sp.]|jgi:hypothetical protein|nr:hypothetical protein [Lachnoclostridium sp.]